MPVDEGLVDAYSAGDAVDAGVLHPALVEQGAGRVDDLALARASKGRARLSGHAAPTKCLV